MLVLLLAAALGACASNAEPFSESGPVPTNARKKAPVKVSVKLLGVPQRAMRSGVLKAIEMRALVRKTDASEAQINRLYRRAEGQIARALEPYGYYQAQVKSSLRKEGAKFIASFEVTLGPRSKITLVDFELDGPASVDTKVLIAWRRAGLKVGEPLSHETYEAAKAAVQRALAERGYLDAELVVRRIEVKRASSEAIVRLHWKTGVRYRLGETTFEGAQFSPEFLQRYMNFDPGELYSQAKLLELQRRLVDADYFSVVEISPDQDAAKDGVVPIQVVLAPAKRSIYTGGVSIGSDSGVGVRTSVQRRWLNDRGHKMGAAGEISQRFKLATVSYDIPKADRARTNYAVSLSYRDEETTSAISKVAKIGIARSGDKGGWQQTIALQCLSGDFDVGGEAASTTLLYPEWILYKRVADDVLAPREGYAFTFNARAGSSALVSKASFASVSANLRHIRVLSERSRLLLHGAAGALWTDDFARMPPELRFFAGGDRSIRGYDYQELGPLNAAGRVRGGKYLAVVSGEYEYALNPSWAVAGFTDLGNAFDVDNAELRAGIGAGVRWRSPVGVVRIDVAYAVDEEENPFRLHLIIGPDL